MSAKGQQPGEQVGENSAGYEWQPRSQPLGLVQGEKKNGSGLPKSDGDRKEKKQAVRTLTRTAEGWQHGH